MEYSLLVLGGTAAGVDLDASAIARSRRSCATSTTSRTVRPARDIQFGTRVTARAFDESARRWRLQHRRWRPGDGDVLHHARSVPVATQCRRLPGDRDFEGEWYHTGRWPQKASISPAAGRRSSAPASSAIQSIPRSREQAAHVYVFQRTPNYSVPAHNRPLDAGIRAARSRREYPEFRRRRASRASALSCRSTGAGAALPAEERSAIYEERWQRGGLGFGFPSPICCRRGGQRHRGGVRPREDPRDRPRPARRRDAGARRITRSAPSACASTPATTRPSTATTSR